MCDRVINRTDDFYDPKNKWRAKCVSGDRKKCDKMSTFFLSSRAAKFYPYQFVVATKSTALWHVIAVITAKEMISAALQKQPFLFCAKNGLIFCYYQIRTKVVSFCANLIWSPNNVGTKSQPKVTRILPPYSSWNEK